MALAGGGSLTSVEGGVGLEAWFFFSKYFSCVQLLHFDSKNL